MENEDLFDEKTLNTELSNIVEHCENISYVQTRDNFRLFAGAGTLISIIVFSPFIMNVFLSLDGFFHFSILFKIIVSSFLMQALFVFGIFLAFFVIPGKYNDWKSELFLENWRFKYLLTGPIAAIVFFLPLAFVSYGSYIFFKFLKNYLGTSWAWLFGPEFKLQQYLLSMNWHYFLIFAFAAVLVAPIVEEIAFRNIIFRSFNVKFGRGTSIFLTSFIFAAVHLDIEHLPSIFILGVILQLFFIRYKSIYPSIFFHATFNFISMLFIAVVKFFYQSSL